MMDAEEILKFHNLKNTGCRKCIINELISNGYALSENELKNSSSNLFDRVTFYRSLKTLEENGVIHRVTLNNTCVKYALSTNNDSDGEHLHFHCVKCDGVVCLETVIPIAENLPSGFLVNSTQVLLEGTCPNCVQK